MTNNLAVVFGFSSVAVFSNETGSPTLYRSKLEASYCGYDNAGNLFVSGYNGQSGAISELPQGKTTFTILSVNGKLDTPGQVQWDGIYMAYEGRGSVPLVAPKSDGIGMNAVLAGQLGRRRSAIELLEDPDDLRFGEAGLFHLSLLGQRAGTHNFNLGYFPTSRQGDPGANPRANCWRQSAHVFSD